MREPQHLTSGRRSDRRLVRGTILLVLVAMGGVTLWYWQEQRPHAGGDRPLERLGHFGTVPDFALIERSERRITRTSFEGLVWVTHFFYTNCPDTCPVQSARMARLQRDVADAPDVRLVSISIDPEHDTPDVLRDYAQHFGADPERWLFLTGDKAAIYRLAQEGFHLSVVDPEAVQFQTPEATPRGEQSESRSHLRSDHREAYVLTLPRPLVAPLRWVVVPHLAQAHSGIEHKTMLHSSRFVLVDRQARIRGYYHSDEAAAMRRLRRDLRTVLQEP